MRHRIVSHLAPRSVAYLTVGVLLGAGGSYALAATSSKTISVCADRGTGLLHLKMRGRCKGGQTHITWNQQGRPGPQGKTGATGPAGAAPPSAWAEVADNGGTLADSGIAVTHLSAGAYQVTVTARACAGRQQVPEITVSDLNPPGGQTAGSFPVGWVLGSLTNQFTVYTGDAVAGTFTPSDHTFFIQDVCGVP